MNADDTGRLLYLALLGAALVFWFFIQNRDSMNTKLQQASVWGLIFVGTIAAVGMWGDIRQTTTFRHSVDTETGSISVPRAPDGHYYLTVDVNDTPVRFVIDTGATDIVLSKSDAESAGINMNDVYFLGRAQTANGVVKVAPVTLDKMQVGPVVDRGVSASVNDGAMNESLLGMTYLQRFGKIEISGGQMILTR
ncbi:retropepsin-like aspartic protease family protein [Arenibacterium sp. CAU 1754]